MSNGSTKIFIPSDTTARSLGSDDVATRLNEAVVGIPEEHAVARAMAQNLVTTFVRFHETLAMHDAVRRMLDAGIAVVDGGPGRLREFVDPYGAGPFDIEQKEHGFELRSALLRRNVPVTLRVGESR